MLALYHVLLLLLLLPLPYSLGARSGPPQDLSPAPMRSQNLTSPQERREPGSWYDRPKLRVLYDSALEFGTPAETLQLYTVRVRNEGPGRVCQLAVRVEEWNETTEWWGIDTLKGNNSYQYMPLYRSDVWTGEDWEFGFIQRRAKDNWPRVDPVYGQTCDGRWFNSTTIIDAPTNPPGTNASLSIKEGVPFNLEGEPYVLYSGRVKNTGNYTITGLGVFIPAIFDTVMAWHVAFDPFTNATYLPLSRHQGLRPNDSTDFGVITRQGQSDNFNLTHVTTANQLWALTASNEYYRGPFDTLGAPPPGTERVVDVARGGRTVAFPPAGPQTRSSPFPSNATNTSTTTTEQAAAPSSSSNTTGAGENAARANTTTTPTSEESAATQTSNNTVSGAEANTTTVSGANSTAETSAGGGGGRRRRAMRRLLS